MNEVSEFLGIITAKVVSRLLDAGKTGIRIHNVTPFDPATMLKELTHNTCLPRIAIAGISVHALAKQTQYPSQLLTDLLATATKWRNDPKMKEPLVVISLEEEERFGSFHRFTEVRDRDLYHEICKCAKYQLCPNEVQDKWWKVLDHAHLAREISVYRLASYFLYIQAQVANIPDASKEGLHLLGMLPSRTFFNQASEPQLRRNIKKNRDLTSRIEILNTADRDRLNRVVEVEDDTERKKFQKTLGQILKYNRSGSEADRAHLFLEDVENLFIAQKTPAKAKSQRTIPIEQAGVDAILGGDVDELEHLGESLREAISRCEEDESPNITVKLTNRGEEATMTVLPSLARLLNRAITADIFGGRFQFASIDTFDSALGDIDSAEFHGFSRTAEKSFQNLLQRIIDAERIEPEVMDSWHTLVEARGELTKAAIAIAISPMVALGSDNALLQSGKSYLEAFTALTNALRDRYERIADHSPKGARHICAQLLTLDTIFLEAPDKVYALLSPLHPLHLWKFIRLVEQLRNEWETLSDEEKQLLSDSAQRLPHFLTALFVPENLLSGHNQALVLPESHQLATLPCYHLEDSHYAGIEGQDRLVRILHKFLAVHQHAKCGLRLCVVNPPHLGDLLEQISVGILNEDSPLEGMQITVLRTLDRPLSLRNDNDQQLEAIASVFAAVDHPRFTLDIKQERTTYKDILDLLRNDPVHVLAIFDPSQSDVRPFRGSDGGFLHPLVLPKEFQYDPIEDELTITHAATGDVFDVYYSLQNRLNDSLSGFHFGVTSSLARDFPRIEELLDSCTWLVVGDKTVDSLPMDCGSMISFEPGLRRDLIVITKNLTKFEREFDYYLRKANFDPTEESVHELIVASSELVGEGLLGLIRADGDD